MLLVVVKFLSCYISVNDCLHYYIFGPLDVVYQLFYIIHGMTPRSNIVASRLSTHPG